MPKYEFESLELSLELPDEYLTIDQVERGYRALVSKGSDTLDLEDPASGRILLQAILGEKCPDLSKLPAQPQTMQMLFEMYGHVGQLFAKSMAVGDEIIQEEEKKEPTPEKPAAKKRARQRSESK